MKKHLFAISLLLTLLLLGCSQRVSFKDTKGQNINFRQLHGKWVFINYWATWCAPCREEIPELNQFYEKHKDHNAIVIGVNFDGLQQPALNKAIATFNITFPVLVKNPAEKLRLSLITVVPTTFVLDPHGKLVAKLTGPQTELSLQQVMRRGA